MVMPKASAIQIIPGPKPSVAFTPALGVVLRDWYIFPIVPIGPGVTTEDTSPIGVALDLFMLPYRLSFNRIAYRTAAGTTLPPTVSLQLALYTAIPVTRILSVSHIPTDAPATMTITLPDVVTLEPGIYWIGRRRSGSVGDGQAIWYEAWGGSGFDIIGQNLPSQSISYHGFISATSLPETFDPYVDFPPNALGTYTIPKLRLYTAYG